MITHSALKMSALPLSCRGDSVARYLDLNSQTYMYMSGLHTEFFWGGTVKVYGMVLV